MNTNRSNITLALIAAALATGCRSQRSALEDSARITAVDTADASSGPAIAAPSTADASATTSDAASAGRLRACNAGEQPAPELAAVPEQFGWRVDESAASTGQPAAIVATCQRLSTAAERARTTVAATVSDDTRARAQFAELGRCHYAGSGAWAIDAGRARIRTAREQSTAVRVGEVDWTVVFVKSDGTVVRSRHHGLLRSGSEAIATFEWRLFHDLDRDGTAEAGFTVGSGNPSEGDAERDRGTLVSFANNVIGPYARAPNADPSRPYDADGDQDPDLVIRSGFSAGNTCGPAIFYGPDELLVLQPDGTFDARGPAAQEFVRAQCEEIPMPPVNFWVQGAGESPFRVACWRYNGTSAEDIQRMIDRDWPADADDHCNSRDGTIAALRSAQPAFRLTTRCQ